MILSSVECFNQTRKEARLDDHEDRLLEPDDLNRAMIPWRLWYSGERPHGGLILKSPIQFLTEKYPKKRHMFWPNTRN